MSSDAKGKTVAILGPDGAGKSTVLDLVQRRLRDEGEDVAYRYFAPGYLKRYRPKPDARVTTNPHETGHYDPLRTAAKIALMVYEFRMGMPQVRRAHRLTLFDRYIFDLLIDPRRHRIFPMRGWMRAMVALAPKPDLLIVVSAPTEVIQARKQEVPAEETARQVAAYETLARSMPNGFVVHNTASPEAAAQAVMSHLDKLR
ncbi:ATP-binding cassette domain-containing protein [uncultured Maritimibacter sp.]|jgi:thymidylate kinase|uniref:ATP-binding cassette domain-containing protein n=1 Tax=uncultured Maritimibacter sp. TaxID=991866 RepID=UPI000B292ED2|nr:ATP-binding cassette domain-containing protein [uncultured Maritimibacter sp.]